MVKELLTTMSGKKPISLILVNDSYEKNESVIKMGSDCDDCIGCIFKTVKNAKRNEMTEEQRKIFYQGLKEKIEARDQITHTFISQMAEGRLTTPVLKEYLRQVKGYDI